MVDYLIIARSGRALAASAKRAGYKVIVVDFFADEDTKSFAESVHQLQYHSDGFAVEPLLKHIQEVVRFYPDMKLVLGSGFESTPELLDSLHESAVVLNNSKETILRLKEPMSFCGILDKAGIKYPDTSYSRPVDSKRYLLKQVAGDGGGHVRWFDKTSPSVNSDFYYQEYISGIVSSVVFLSNGTRGRIVGYNQQLQTGQFVDMPFLYQGAVTTNETSERHKHIIQKIIDAIILETGLMGLCGLDYIIDESGEIMVLEVNPRPPATFELHETKQSLFDAHLACFDGSLLDYKQHHDNDEKVRGCAIFYTEKDLKIYDKINWPLWVKDRPSSGTIIPLRFPVCTVHAQENSIDKLKSVLSNRLKQIKSIVFAMQNAA